jgi:hypothetical protein
VQRRLAGRNAWRTRGEGARVTVSLPIPKHRSAGRPRRLGAGDEQGAKGAALPPDPGQCVCALSVSCRVVEKLFRASVSHALPLSPFQR